MAFRRQGAKARRAGEVRPCLKFSKKSQNSFPIGEKKGGKGSGAGKSYFKGARQTKEPEADRCDQFVSAAGRTMSMTSKVLRATYHTHPDSYEKAIRGLEKQQRGRRNEKILVLSNCLLRAPLKKRHTQKTKKSYNVVETRQKGSVNPVTKEAPSISSACGRGKGEGEKKT